MVVGEDPFWDDGGHGIRRSGGRRLRSDRDSEIAGGDGPIIGALSQRQGSLGTTCEESSFKVRYCPFRPLEVEPVFLTTILAMVFAAVAERALSVMLIASIPVFDQCFFAGSCPSRRAIGFLDDPFENRRSPVPSFQIFAHNSRRSAVESCPICCLIPAAHQRRQPHLQ